AYLTSGEKDFSRNATFFKEVIERIETLPGVEAVGAASSAPMRLNENGPFRIEGQLLSRPGDAVVYAERPKITPNYFRAMGIHLARGREFTWEDKADTPFVAIVSETLVHRYWPHDDAIGQRLSVEDKNGAPIWRQVVGIVKDTKHDDLTDP